MMLITCRLRFTLQTRSVVKPLIYARWYSQGVVRPQSTVVRVTLPSRPKQALHKTVHHFSQVYEQYDLEQRHTLISYQLQNSFIPSLGIMLQKHYPTVVAQKPYAFIIDNMPVDPWLPASPISHDSPAKKSAYTELTMLGAISVLGYQPYVCWGEKNNSLFHNVVPLPQDSHKKSGTGSKVKFDWHTENIHEQRPPDAIVLFCLRGDPNAKTSLLFLEDILSVVPEPVIKALMEPNFAMRTGPSFAQLEEYLGAILQEDEREGLVIRYNSDNVRLFGKTPAAQQSLDAFRACVDEVTPQKSHILQLAAGNFLFFNNRKALHKRDPFEVSTDFNKRRWLQRVYTHKTTGGLFDEKLEPETTPHPDFCRVTC